MVAIPLAILVCWPTSGLKLTSLGECLGLGVLLAFCMSRRAAFGEEGEGGCISRCVPEGLLDQREYSLAEYVDDPIGFGVRFMKFRGMTRLSLLEDAWCRRRGDSTFSLSRVRSTISWICSSPSRSGLPATRIDLISKSLLEAELCSVNMGAPNKEEAATLSYGSATKFI